MIITIPDDFDLEKIKNSGQAFRITCTDGCYRFMTGNHVLHMRQLSAHTFYVSCRKETWRSIWAPYFDLDRSYRSLRRKIPAADKYLSAAAEQSKGIRILRQDPFETIITFIISQRKSIPAISSSVEKICTLSGKKLTSRKKTVYAFPSPRKLAACPLQSLYSCSLGYRAPYIKKTAWLIAGGTMDLDALHALSDDDLMKSLMTLPGVGTKVASCIALFAYARLSLAPVDVWIQKVICQKYGGVNPFPSFGDSAGIYQQYMFYYARTSKLK